MVREFETQGNKVSYQQMLHELDRVNNHLRRTQVDVWTIRCLTEPIPIPRVSLMQAADQAVVDQPHEEFLGAHVFDHVSKLADVRKIEACLCVQVPSLYNLFY